MRLLIACIVSLAAAALAAGTACAQEPKKPAAQYLMSVATEGTTVPGMAAGNGLDGMLASMVMGAMGGGTHRSLWLDLLGPETPPAPAAEHQVPAGLKMGASLPLLTPAAVTGGERETPGEAGEREDIRILFYWGCGETVRRGQPKVFDTAKMSADAVGQLPVARKGSSLVRLSPRQGWTYGEWPNRDTRKQVPGDGSLAGNHLIRGNYAPDIGFALDPRHDFMEPVAFTRAGGELAAAIPLAWRPVPNATGYFMTATGATGEGKEVIMWNSSEPEELGAGLMDYLPPGRVQQYIKEKVVLAPETTSCTIPQGIFKGADGAVLMFIAYGPEANFAEPPKPADPKAPWDPIWTAKVRFKSTGMLPLGMETAEAGGEPQKDPAQAAGQKDAPAESGESNPLKGVMDGAKKLKGVFGF